MIFEKPSVEFVPISTEMLMLTSGCEDGRGNCDDNETGGGTVCYYAWANYNCGEASWRLDNEEPSN